MFKIPLEIKDFSGNSVIIYKALAGYKSSDSTKNSDTLFGLWEIPIARAKKADYLVIAVKNIVVEVRQITGWEASQVNPNRYKCLSETSATLEGILGKSIENLYNPRDKTILRFFNC